MLRKQLNALAAFAVLAIAPATAEAQSHTKDIVTTAVEAGSFTTLAAALEAANLVEMLQGDDPFTVFAPTDEAFAKLPDGAPEALLADKEALARVLTYHVVAGRVTSEAVVDIAQAETVAGIAAPIEVKMGEVYVAGSKVVATDIAASNGVIHVIDDVMLPPEM